MSGALEKSSFHELGHGLYRASLSRSGGGQSRWDWIALSRWHGPTLEDAHGFFIYLRDVDSGELWSAGLQPTLKIADHYEVTFSAEQAFIEREDHDIAAKMTIAVAVNDELEKRSLRLHNQSSRPRRIELTSYVEVALAHPRADMEHPAFLKLFVQTSIDDTRRALVARRRPRDSAEVWPLMFHALAGADVQDWETDRLQFLGRGGYVARPSMDMRGTLGNVLDPVLSLRSTVTLAAGESRVVDFLLGAVPDHGKLADILARYGASPLPQLEQQKSNVKSAAIVSGFNDDSSEYVIRLPWNGKGLSLPPMPWVNVIANERFGCIISEIGAGCTWSRNSQANRLTPWSNDPVSDPHGEALFVRNDDSGVYWSPLAGPAPAAVEYEVRHGFGYSRYASVSNDLRQHATVFVARRDPVKFVKLRLQNSGPTTCRLSVYGYQHLVLGVIPENPSNVRTWLEGSVLCGSKDGAGEFSGALAFSKVVCSLSATESVCCDRKSFLGAEHNLQSPMALSQPELDGTIGAGLDPCFARQLRFKLLPGQSAEVSFIFGEALSEQELHELVVRYSSGAALDAAFAEASLGWKESLGGLRVTSASPEIDRMINGWLPYQALSSRILGRTAFYQSSGAYGFRDQLQDAGNLCLLWPELTRRQILLHAGHQFEEGDVLHWWHGPPVERGVRTRFSDDLLWLPYVTYQYMQCTGDVQVLDAVAPFLKGPELDAAEQECYLKPCVSSEQGSVFEHCCRALDRSLTAGRHGLPLMGSGDWNDGMNRVGSDGRGESVWLGFFLYQILEWFIPLARQRGDALRADRYALYRKGVRQQLDIAGWDGNWYRRAYYDNGTPLGTRDAAECRIDGLVQAWAVLSDGAPANRAAQAMDAVERQLVNEADGLIRLLTPPFVNAPEDPGYIKGYVAGVRENGGQYTHAACWMVAAMAKLGRRDRALQLLIMLSPTWHTRNAEQVERYRVEPYVIAADIYGAEPHVGLGGWTWYTGSAGLAYRIAVESVLGLRLEGGRNLLLSPCVPDDWPDYYMEYRIPGSITRYIIDVRNPHGRTESVVGATIDGVALQPSRGIARVPVTDDGASHRVVITLG